MADDTIHCLAGAAMKEVPHPHESHTSCRGFLRPAFRPPILRHPVCRRLKKNHFHKRYRALKIGLAVLATLPFCAHALASPVAQGSLDNLPDGTDIAASAAATAIAGSKDYRPAADADGSPWNFGGLMMRLFGLGTASRDMLQRLSEEARIQVAAMEQVIERTGLDVEDLLAHFGSGRHGAGGPFIAVSPSAHNAGKQEIDPALNSSLVRWDLLRDVIRSLPLAEPVAASELTSRFGNRSDPFNKRWAMHQGIDFGAPMKTPVVATASGVVVFAGWKGSYGRLVEIGHGPRVVTRYAHLAKILVEEGDSVQMGDRIGLLGSSGRSSGPHLHYEVLFDDAPRDPMMFIQAGREALPLGID